MTELSAAAFRMLEAGAPIADGTVAPFYLEDQKLRVCVARLEGRLYAFDDLCTCDTQSCPLSSGLLTGRTVMCQCHGSRFDITTGAVVDGPASTPLTVYVVQEIDGELQIRL